MTTGLYTKYTLVNTFDLKCQCGICISYNTGNSALPDTYAQAQVHVEGKCVCDLICKNPEKLRFLYHSALGA